MAAMSRGSGQIPGGEREAHVREVQRYAQTLPDGSYGQGNRQAIADRDTRVANRLRAVEQAYRTATEHHATLERPELAQGLCSPECAADREIEMG
jgi:hypothetical protein